MKQIRRGNKESITRAFAVRNGIPIYLALAIVTRADDRKYQISTAEWKSPVPISGRKYLVDAVADAFMKLPGLLQRLVNEAFAKWSQNESACEFFELRKGLHFWQNAPTLPQGGSGDCGL